MKKLMYFLLVLLGFSSNLLCQNDCSYCEKVLIQDYLSFKWSDSLALHYLNQIDNSNYTSQETQAVLNGNFPIANIPVGVGINYNDFSSYRSRLINYENFHFTQLQSLDLIKRTLSRDVLTAFNICMKTCTSNNRETNIYLSNVDTASVSIRIKYFPGPGIKDKLTVRIRECDNLTYKEKKNQIKLRPEDSKVIVFKRRDYHKISYLLFDLKINNNITSKEINIAGYPILKKYKIVSLNETDDGHQYGNILPKQIIRVSLKGDYDFPKGKVFDGYYLNDKIITFGEWSNRCCATNGAGWYINKMGSCWARDHLTCSYGDDQKGLLKLDVIVEDN